MSRIGKKPISVPAEVKISSDGLNFSIVGPKGALAMKINPEVRINVSESEVMVEKIGKTKKAPAIWGTTARLIENMIQGVIRGFQKKLELNGVGYRMSVQGKKINMALGFSHPVEVDIPDEISVSIEGNLMTVSGISKQKVGQFAANVKKLKPVEPYKGKGFRYVGEIVRKKEGKKSSS